MSNAMTACGRRSPGAAMRHDPAAGAIVIMLRSLKMHGMSQAVTDPIGQDAPAFEASVPILSQLLKAELAEREVRSIACHMKSARFPAYIDLFSRRVVGWSAQPRMTTDLALQALLAAVWRRKPKTKVMIHSDQGSQFTSREWQLFLSQHNLEASMSRRGNCHDNAVAESFFQLLKRERIRRRTYLTREAARQDVFEYIEMFYNPKRKHTNNGMLSPVDFETRQQKLNEAGV